GRRGARQQATARRSSRSASREGGSKNERRGRVSARGGRSRRRRPLPRERRQRRGSRQRPSRIFRLATTGAGTPACEPPSATHFSSSITSWAVCQRSSGSLARQVLTTRSRAGGTIGWIEEIGGGCVPMIAAIHVAWLGPG